ncbi:hypothetical protein BGX30_000332, partial [Mortierella sp. GBA39]
MSCLFSLFSIIVLATVAHFALFFRTALAVPLLNSTSSVAASEEGPGPNLTSEFRWWTNKSFFNDPNGVFHHDIFFTVDETPLGRLMFDSSGFATYCHEYYEWCITQDYPQTTDFYVWYKGYT